MAIKRVQKKIAWTAEDRERHKMIRDTFKDRPSIEELVACGELSGQPMPLGAYLNLKLLVRSLRQLREQAQLSLADVAAREAQAPTGLGDGIGIPHCRSAHVTRPSLAFGRSTRGLDFDAPDGRPADLVFLIAAPDGADDAHLQILASLARRLLDPEFTGALRSATSAG